MSTIGRCFTDVRRAVPEGVQLVAVSKFHPVEHLLDAYAAGCRVMGESRVQELCAKREQLPQDIEWHFIGHLQPNKVKYIAPFVSLIHAVDTPKLLAEISRRALACARCVPCLLQVHVAREETKFGFTPDELRQFLDEGAWRQMEGARIDGLMCMASNTDDMAQVEAEFTQVRTLFDELRARHFADASHFRLRSYGMSHDWPVAVRCGSNMVRIGTAIFGQRA
ncbi:MAG: YggS family pyridoxal phosphate-dependent enzyme [Bacteroidaceae bacterium]|nr:YggS family pyridoxal phosphate-dependent enzyme [Bacteroidaceae bacterium]